MLPGFFFLANILRSIIRNVIAVNAHIVFITETPPTTVMLVWVYGANTLLKMCIVVEHKESSLGHIPPRAPK